MTKTKVSKPSNVINIDHPDRVRLFPERAILPPEGWELKGKHGFNRAEIADGNTIDLARLGDVLDWLETTQELPRKTALERLLEGLEKGISQGVYCLHQGKYAECLPDDFGYWANLVLNPSRRWKRLDGYVPPLKPLPPKGIDSLRVLLNYQHHNSQFVAVPITAAYAAWGYGRIEAPAVDAGATQKPSLTAQDVTDWETLVSYRKNTGKGKRWDDKQRQVLKAELTRRIKTDKSNKGESQIKEEMASELGLESRQAIDKQINAMGSISKRDTKRGRLAG